MSLRTSHCFLGCRGRMNLFCLSFAGGSASAYRGLQDLAGDKLAVIPLELPGRGRRFSQKLCKDIHAMAEDQFSLIRDRLCEPYALFGHSMGTWLVYLMARRAVTEKVRLPECIFVSGWKGPSAENCGKYHLMPREEFFAMLRDLGGCPEAVLAERELMEMCEPIIRADFQAVETYKHEPADPFPVPVVVLSGESDREVSRPDLALWEKETTAGVQFHSFPGGHFYIFDQWPAILNIIRSRLAK